MESSNIMTLILWPSIRFRTYETQHLLSGKGFLGAFTTRHRMDIKELY